MADPAPRGTSRTILAISGSLRRASTNSAVLRAAAVAAAEDGIRVEIADSVRDLPPFDPDRETQPPQSALRFRKACEDAAGVLLAVPEYTFGIPGSFKNALDWTVGSGSLYRKPVDVRLGNAACSGLERHLPYVPLAAALRDALTGVELDSRSLPALRQILPELTPAEPAQDFAEVDALEALVGLIREHAPLVLVLDDLQLADPQTIAALGYLQRRCADVPAALVAAVRSETAPPEHPVRRLRPATVVRLEPLTAAELAPLGMPDLHETTGGNPRFVSEAIATGSRREYSSALAEMLLEQCRAEGALAYRVLVAASVLEQPFEPELLAALLLVDPAELTEELERLCERHILRVDGFRFRFRYDLVREVLLASLSPARQRLLRERIDDEGRTISTGRASRSAEG